MLRANGTKVKLMRDSTPRPHRTRSCNEQERRERISSVIPLEAGERGRPRPVQATLAGIYGCCPSYDSSVNNNHHLYYTPTIANLERELFITVSCIHLFYKVFFIIIL